MVTEDQLEETTDTIRDTIKDSKVINLAGIMGGSSTSCSNNTKTVLVECAYFSPESIIGRSIKYDLNSGQSEQ